MRKREKINQVHGMRRQETGTCEGKRGIFPSFHLDYVGVVAHPQFTLGLDAMHVRFRPVRVRGSKINAFGWIAHRFAKVGRAHP